MKKLLSILLIPVFLVSASSVVFASDWDKAGKAFAVIEGLRVLSGGKVDVIGNITGTNSYRSHGYHQRHHKHRKRHYARHYDCTERVWVPHFKWRKKYVPEHERYDEKYGKVIVEGHYIRYQIERGGHWESQYTCD